MARPDQVRPGAVGEVHFLGVGIPQERVVAHGQHLDQLSSRDPVEAIMKKTSSGATGNLKLDVAHAMLQELAAAVEKDEGLSREKLAALAGRDVDLFRDPLR